MFHWYKGERLEEGEFSETHKDINALERFLRCLKPIDVREKMKIYHINWSPVSFYAPFLE